MTGVAAVGHGWREEISRQDAALFRGRSFWFSAKGRINRWPYVVANLILGALTYMWNFFPTESMVVVGLYFLVIPFVFWAGVCVSVKRAHDRGRSGWFILIFFVPLLNFWPMIELTFFRGTPGPNKFGPDPLG